MVSFSAARCWVKRTGGRETSGTRTANLIALVAADRRRILERRRLGVSSPGGRWRREVQERRARDRTPPNGRWHRPRREFASTSTGVRWLLRGVCGAVYAGLAPGRACAPSASRITRRGSGAASGGGGEESDVTRRSRVRLIRRARTFNSKRDHRSAVYSRYNDVRKSALARIRNSRSRRFEAFERL